MVTALRSRPSATRRHQARGLIPSAPTWRALHVPPRTELSAATQPLTQHASESACGPAQSDDTVKLMTSVVHVDYK